VFLIASLSFFFAPTINKFDAILKNAREMLLLLPPEAISQIPNTRAFARAFAKGRQA
jgi:hypothetical protein